jgi:hypothetical protein
VFERIMSIEKCSGLIANQTHDLPACSLVPEPTMPAHVPDFDLMLSFTFKKKKRKTKLHGLSPRANYTDRATAACRRSHCKLFADRGYHMVSLMDPYGCILRFLDRNRYFSIK